MKSLVWKHSLQTRGEYVFIWVDGRKRMCACVLCVYWDRQWDIKWVQMKTAEEEEWKKQREDKEEVWIQRDAPCQETNSGLSRDPEDHPVSNPNLTTHTPTQTHICAHTQLLPLILNLYMDLLFLSRNHTVPTSFRVQGWTEVCTNINSILHVFGCHNTGLLSKEIFAKKQNKRKSPTYCAVLCLMENLFHQHF